MSYQQARNYTVKYEAGGVEALIDNRDKRKSPDEMSELEKLRAKVKILRAEKEYAENILNREFTAEAPNEKWLTDVTEFHYYIGIEKHKVYLSAILDLYDRRIVSYVIRDNNNNALVFDTINEALQRNTDAQPLFHSDRGFQYTNRTFHAKLVNAGITQSISRECIDNAPMEGFWGILKQERYYGKRFTDKETLVKMIEDYIDYYNNKRLQRNLGVLTPMEKHDIYLQAA